MAERSFAKEVEQLKIGAGEEFRGEGILAVTKALLECGVAYVARLPGRADLAPDGRARRRAGHHGRARRAFRVERLRGDRRRDACRLGALSDPRRRDLQVAPSALNVASDALANLASGGVKGGALDHPRRGLRRRLLHHAGAQPRFCDEVADLAARSAPEPREDRAVGARRLRAVGSLQHAGDAGGAHPLLPRARPLQGARQPASEDEPRRGAGEPAARPEPHRAAARLLSAREGEDREALAGGGEIHPRARAERAFRAGGRPGRHRHARAACTTA